MPTAGSLAIRELGFARYSQGEPQQAGALTVLPLFGASYREDIVPPRSGLKMARVTGYGQMEVANLAAHGTAIVPLHMGYIQDRAQNHALCRSAFIAAGQSLLFDDACCVQAAQGGYLQESEQWFFILPQELRYEALRLRGRPGYSKLWPAIAKLNSQIGLPSRGHLEQILSRQRAQLTQFQTRLELLPEQVGAAFFIGDHPVGLEIAPTSAYFAELWMPLTCFSYGVRAWRAEAAAGRAEVEGFSATSLAELTAELEARRRLVRGQVQDRWEQLLSEQVEVCEEERFREMKLFTAIGRHFAGQYVLEQGLPVYASFFARYPSLFTMH